MQIQSNLIAKYSNSPVYANGINQSGELSKKIQFLISQLGQGVEYPNENRNYCIYNEERTGEIVNLGEEALPYLENFLKTADTEEKILDALQILDKMLDKGVKGIDKMYPVLSKFNDTSSPNVQVMLAGIYRKTLVPDAFGPLAKMLIKQSFNPNSQFFDPTEEIGGAILEYIRCKSAVNTYQNNVSK